ncbi:MAG TPA: hypothetical protein P5319_12900, partial [Gemmatimonadales bacterium]|nr:hypothetical protein [Gemmatimonadales bacterium]
MTLPRGVSLAVLATLLAVAPLRAQDAPLIVRGLRFKGNHALDATQLSTAIATTNSSWFARAGMVRWMGLGEKR